MESLKPISKRERERQKDRYTDRQTHIRRGGGAAQKRNRELQS